MRALVVLLTLAVSQPPMAFAQSRPQPPAPLGPSSGPKPLLFGFALDCTRCRLTPGDGDPMPVWRYVDLPRVAAVRPGSAAAVSGIMVGDTIVAVDGMSILSANGARRFSTVRAGERVRFTLKRGGEERDVTVALRRAGEPPSPRVASAGQPAYSGQVAGASVDVWGLAPAAVTVDSTGAIVMQIGPSTVRVSPTRDGKANAIAARRDTTRTARP